jgi:glutaredoxin
MLSKTWCPFSLDAKDLLGSQIGVVVHSLEVNTHPQGGAIFKYLSNRCDHHTVPMVFLNGKFVGGCDDIKALYKNGELQRTHLKGLITRKQTMNTEKLETAQLIPMERSTAINPPFWFPNQVNNHVVRATGLQVFVLSVLSAVFYYNIWGRYLAVGLLVDFGLRLISGASLSPLAMNATFMMCFFKPDFRAGPPKQFAAFCGLSFSLMGTLFYFLDFEAHDIVGAIFMAMLAFASGLEAFLDFCLGCLFYGYVEYHSVLCRFGCWLDVLICVLLAAC